MTIDKIIIGTRGSKLALYQANKVKSVLNTIHPDIETEIKIVKTKGDKILDVALSKIGDKGLFTKELETELENGSVHLAVHSLKDLPTQLDKQFTISSILKRGDFRDAFVSKNSLKISDLTDKNTIATSSLRRIANLKNIHPKVNTVDVRGNVNTRLQKMDDGLCDGMIMAAAGLIRLGLEDRITEILDPKEYMPAVAQGAIAIESLSSNSELNSILKDINDTNTEICTSAEREFMKVLQGGCQVPVGAYSEFKNNELKLYGVVSSLNADRYIKDCVEGKVNSVDDAKQLGNKLASKLVAQGAKEILDEINETR